MYDVIVLGATGFTGRLCAEFIAKTYPHELKWALAGRNVAGLEEVAAILKTTNADRNILKVQLTLEELEPLAKKTRMIINGVGPYHKYSTPVVEACAKHGTDCLDFTTETLWIKELAEKYHLTAKASGAKILPGISPTAPSDLIAWLVANKIRDTFSTGTSDIVATGKLQISAMSGGSATTVLDSVATYGPWWYLFGDSWVLAFLLRPTSIPRPPWITRLFGYRSVPGLGIVTTSFTGPGNESIVHRSYSQNPDLYGPSFNYQEHIPAGGFGSAFFVHFLTKFGVILLSLPFMRALFRKLLPPVGTGPDLAAVGGGEYATYHAVGKADNDSHFSAEATFSRNGSLYEFTALLTCVGALMLLENRVEDERAGKDIRGTGGVLTASHLGMPYVERLREAGAKIEVSLMEN